MILLRFNFIFGRYNIGTDITNIRDDHNETI